MRILSMDHVCCSVMLCFNPATHVMMTGSHDKLPQRFFCGECAEAFADSMSVEVG